eukprot:tig00020610_g11995.t1
MKRAAAAFGLSGSCAVAASTVARAGFRHALAPRLLCGGRELEYGTCQCRHALRSKAPGEASRAPWGALQMRARFRAARRLWAGAARLAAAATRRSARVRSSSSISSSGRPRRRPAAPRSSPAGGPALVAQLDVDTARAARKLGAC